MVMRQYSFKILVIFYVFFTSNVLENHTFKKKYGFSTVFFFVFRNQLIMHKTVIICNCGLRIETEVRSLYIVQIGVLSESNNHVSTTEIY